MKSNFYENVTSKDSLNLFQEDNVNSSLYVQNVNTVKNKNRRPLRGRKKVCKEALCIFSENANGVKNKFFFWKILSQN